MRLFQRFMQVRYCIILVWANSAPVRKISGDKEAARSLVSTGVTLDRISLRPPSPQDLMKLHKSALQRAELFVQTFISPAGAGLLSKFTDAILKASSQTFFQLSFFK